MSRSRLAPPFVHRMRMAAAAASLLLAVACGGDTPSANKDGGRVTSVELSQGTVTLGVGSTVSLQAILRDAGGAPVTGRPVVWTSGDATIATVSPTGVVTALRTGTVQIAATVDGRSAVATLTISPRAVASLQVTPPDPRLLVGEAVKLSARTLDETGAALEGRRIQWTSSSAAVAAVDTTGLVVGIAPGVATITATSEGRSVTVGVSVSLVPIVRIDVTPVLDTVVVGQTTQFTATPRDSVGGALGDRMVSWGTSDVSVASVSSSGLATGIAPGIITITASSAGRTTDVRLVVRPRPVASVIVSPAQAALIVGQSVQLTTQVTDDRGNLLLGRAVQFSSANNAIASVSAGGVVSAVGVGSTTINVASEGYTGVVNVQVSPVPAASIRLDPATADLVVGNTLRLNATVLDASGNVLSGRPVTWTSGSPNVASIAADGTITAVGAGSVIVLASREGRTATASVTVRAIPVTTVTVTPRTATVIVGDAIDLSAEARDATGAVISRPVFWTSSDERIAVVSSTGRVRTIAIGRASITGSIDGVTATSDIDVIVEPVLSVAVAPATLSLVPGGSSTLTATLRGRSDVALQGRVVTWSSSDANVATVSSTGVVTAIRTGTATITATSEGKQGTASVQVLVAPVSSVTLTLGAPTLTVGGSTQSTVVLRDGFGVVLTGRDIVFSSSNNGVATVSATGAVTAVGAGSATITATSEGKSASANLTVTTPPPAPVATVSVTLADATLIVGASTQASALLKDASGNALTGRAVTWSSSNPSVATVSASGVVSALAAGSASITASSEGRSGSAAVTVSNPPPAPVATVSASLGTSSLVIGGSTQASVLLKDAAGNTLTGRTVTWSTSNANVATVSASGAVTAIGAGTASITATSEGKTGSATLTVTQPAPAPVATVSVTLGDNSLTTGVTTQASALLKDAGGNTLTGRTVTWSTSNAAVASVNASGVVSAVGAGTATITATSEGKTGSASVTVTNPAPAPVATVSVALGSSSLLTGGTTQATVTLRDAGSNTLTGRTVTWSSSNTNVATVSASGLVTATGAGSASITATSEGETGSATVTVSAPPPTIASIDVALGRSTIVTGATTQALASVRTSAGSVVANATVTWTSSAPGIASVSSDGLITGLQPGTAIITATNGAVSGSATVTVQLVPVARIDVSPSSATVQSKGPPAGRTVQLTATLYDANNAIITGRAVTWRVTSGTAASVSSTGLVMGLQGGTVVVTATAEGKSDTATITVSN